MTTPYHHHYYEDNRGYVTPPSDNHHHYTDNSNNNNNEEEVIFSLTERLREKEDEVRHLRQENSELENQLILQGNLPIKLDTAYEELLAHLKQREEDFKLASTKYEERQCELERENRKLKDKVHASGKIMDEQEHNMALVEKETEDELKKMRQQMDTIMANSAVSSRDLEQENHKLKERVHASRQLLEEQEQNISMIGREAGEELKLMQQQLDSAMKEIDEKDRQIVRLEDMIQRQSLDADRYKKQEAEDKALLARLGDRVENYRYEQDELVRENDELQRRVQTQHHLLKEKEDELLHMERFRDQREDELNDDIDRMRHRFNEVITSQRMVLDDREEQIQLLYRQIDRYDDICEEADWVTKEQRSALKANKKEIEELSQAIDRVQNSGLLSQLDNMCTGKIDSSNSIVGS